MLGPKHSKIYTKISLHMSASLSVHLSDYNSASLPFDFCSFLSISQPTRHASLRIVDC